MLRQFEAELVLPTGERVSPTMGSVLHGALMERLPADVAEFLHTERLRPYSQSVRYEKESGRTLWRIHTLTDELGQIFAAMLGAKQDIFLRQKGYAVRVQDFRCVWNFPPNGIKTDGYAVRVQDFRCVAETDDAAIADLYFLPEGAPRGAEITFCTTTAFKRDGQYVLLPELYLIVQSLLARWSIFCPRVRMDEDGLAQQLDAAYQISQYALRTAGFSVDGHTLRGFRGTLSMRFTGTDSVRRILGMLMEFAPYAGIGIKTALGMGSVCVNVWRAR